MKRSLAFAMVLSACGLGASLSAGAQTIYPAKDGTLADGGLYGPFDGIADDADWYFNESSYEGSIALSTDERAAAEEHRVVWEYSLNTVSYEPPVAATLTFTIRGAPIWPFPDVVVHVYSYPADLQETMDDFHAGPAILQGSVTVLPYQDPTVYTVDASTAVSEALTSGENMVAFRYQIDPGTLEDANQAFIDALDSDPTTKPFLTIDEAPPAPGDADEDGDVDLVDYASFESCMSGPDTTPGSGCDVFDFDQDVDVDLEDFERFQNYFTG